MKKYSTINWNEKDADEVYDFLILELETQEKYPFFLWLMQNFPNVEIDWLETFEELREELFENGQIDAIISFVDWYKLKNPSDYNERYAFIESDVCNYYFYKNDFEKLQERVAYIQQHPVWGIDILTERLLYQLIYNGHYNLAISYAEAVWQPVSESDKLIGFAAYPFINTIYVSQLQKCYDASLHAINFDEDELFLRLASMGFEDDKPQFARVLIELKGELNNTAIKDSILKGQDNHMLVLNIHFLKHMLHTYQLPFVFSEWIWNFIATTKIFGQLEGLENWFYIDSKTMDEHINRQLGDILALNELEIFGKVWGLDFVFSFLHKEQLLSDEHYGKMLENISHFKNEMIRSMGVDLWHMLFVFNWPGVNKNTLSPLPQSLFDKTFNTSYDEIYENINRHLSLYEVPERIQDELNFNNSEEESQFPLWEENTPYIKKEPDTGRNAPCPCGSGKKYKKCCLNK